MSSPTAPTASLPLNAWGKPVPPEPFKDTVLPQKVTYLHARLEAIKKIWAASEIRQNVYSLFIGRPKAVEALHQIIVLALGNFSELCDHDDSSKIPQHYIDGRRPGVGVNEFTYRMHNELNARLSQLAWVLDVAALVKEHTGRSVKIVTQDPAHSATDEAFLNDVGVQVLYHPAAIAASDASTFFYDAGALCPVVEDYLFPYVREGTAGVPAVFMTGLLHTFNYETPTAESKDTFAEMYFAPAMEFRAAKSMPWKPEDEFIDRATRQIYFRKDVVEGVPGNAEYEKEAVDELTAVRAACPSCQQKNLQPGWKAQFSFAASTRNKEIDSPIDSPLYV